MNYTANHHLPQWSESDRVRMDDFNSAMSNIESGMSANASAAHEAQTTASAVKSAALTLYKMAASAESAAAAAQATADAAYSPDNKPYVFGSYTGNSSAGQQILLGFMPSFLIITGMQSSTDPNDNTPSCNYFAMVGSNGTSLNGQMQFRVQLTDQGFIVYKTGSHNTHLPILNEPDRLYYYIAFR